MSKNRALRRKERCSENEEDKVRLDGLGLGGGVENREKQRDPKKNNQRSSPTWEKHFGGGGTCVLEYGDERG